MIKRKITLPVQYFISVLAVCSIAALGFSLSDFTDYRAVAFLLLVTVSILAMFCEIFPVLTAALLSALLWDFLFIPPRFTFSVGSTEDRLTFLLYFVIALINGVLTYKIRQMEKQARQKEEKENVLKLYNTLFNSLSHELQTPVSTIIGATDTLKEHADKLSNENKTALVDEISIASFRLKEQVENLLNMSRVESGHLKLKKDWCDVSELIYATVNKLQTKLASHHIKITIAENLPLFQLDFGIMEQVIHNLVNNAILYTPAGSVISIHVSYTMVITGHFNEDDLSSEAQRDTTIHTLRVVISDNGKGFPEEELEKVFTKFYRLHNSRTGGSGLGLSIAKGFVEAHHGKISLKNGASGGAEFAIEIPSKASYLNALKNE